MVLWFYVQEHPKAQPAVVRVLKHLRRRGHGLKSHPTDWESRESNSGLLLDTLLVFRKYVFIKHSFG